MAVLDSTYFIATWITTKDIARLQATDMNSPNRFKGCKASYIIYVNNKTREYWRQ